MAAPISPSSFCTPVVCSSALRSASSIFCCMTLWMSSHGSLLPEESRAAVADSSLTAASSNTVRLVSTCERALSSESVALPEGLSSASAELCKAAACTNKPSSKAWVRRADLSEGTRAGEDGSTWRRGESSASAISFPSSSSSSSGISTVPWMKRKKVSAVSDLEASGALAWTLFESLRVLSNKVCHRFRLEPPASLDANKTMAQTDAKARRAYPANCQEANGWSLNRDRSIDTNCALDALKLDKFCCRIVDKDSLCAPVCCRSASAASRCTSPATQPRRAGEAMMV
mmetsp:Transcript_9435/g.21078  ORF Transcript_9435/g.21078 Transcript_9435/m.21078 type:complete len:287 (+) Transcript_9435:926-1786(+)